MELNEKNILSMQKALMLFLSDVDELGIDSSLVAYCRSAKEKLRTRASSFSINELNAIVQALGYSLTLIPPNTSNRSLKKEKDAMSQCRYFLLKQIAQATKPES